MPVVVFQLHSISYRDERTCKERENLNNDMLYELWDILFFFKTLLYLASRYVVTYCTFVTVGLYFIHTFIVVSSNRVSVLYIIKIEARDEFTTVSYTHLTLPTKA